MIDLVLGLKKTIFNELFGIGGRFYESKKESIGVDLKNASTPIAQFVTKMGNQSKTRKWAISRILAATLSLQPEAQPSSSSVMTSVGSKPTAQVSSVGVDRSANF